MTSQEYKLVPLTLIDDPENPMRIEPEGEGFEQLIASIEANGLLQPVVLRVKGDRFQIVAGHRRLLAFWRLRRSEIPAVIERMTDDEAIAKEVAENLDREDVDPVSEAHFIARAITKMSLSAEQFAANIHRRAQWVADRLAIAEMPDFMQDALKSGKLKIGVALRLAEIDHEPTLRKWVHSAIESGMTVRSADYALKEYQRIKEFWDQTGQPAPATPIADAPAPVLFVCARCGQTGPVEAMKTVQIHREGCLSIESGE